MASQARLAVETRSLGISAKAFSQRRALVLDLLLQQRICKERKFLILISLGIMERLIVIQSNEILFIDRKTYSRRPRPIALEFCASSLISVLVIESLASSC